MKKLIKSMLMYQNKLKIRRKYFEYHIFVQDGYNYYDNKRNPVSKMTNAYISSLQGYVAGLGLLLYGIMSLWH